MLRDYQQRTLDQLYSWFNQHDKGNPCLSLPTGSGKSWIIAGLCKDALQSWPETKILMITHQQELIAQDYEKLRIVWPGAPVGIYSASLRRRDLGDPITFAGIQSIRNRTDEIGHVDLIIVDECHLIGHKAEGGYRRVIDELVGINPALRVVGLTATPFRLGHGLITDDPAIFDAIIEPVTIEELIYKGHLATLRSKITKTAFDTSSVHKRGGEYIEKEPQAAVDTAHNNESVVDETIRLAGNRKSWVFFCTGIDHAEHIKELLIERGITAECVTGKTPRGKRDEILTDFKAGSVQAVTSVGVLTTGFDAPNIDLIAMLRPTLSPGLYVQMAGRGLRPKSHIDHCIVLDFAGVVQTHGPITAVEPPKKGGTGGEAPVKDCPECAELVHISVMVCPECGYIFPPPETATVTLHNDDIMGLEATDMTVTSWRWMPHTSRTSGKEMIRVIYYGGLSDPMISEYLAITHDGYAGQKAIRTLHQIAINSGAKLTGAHNIEILSKIMTESTKPSMISYRRDGKFHRVLDRSWA